VDSGSLPVFTGVGRNDIKDRDSLIAIEKSLPAADGAARSAAVQNVQAVQNVGVKMEAKKSAGFPARVSDFEDAAMIWASGPTGLVVFSIPYNFLDVSKKRIVVVQPSLECLQALSGRRWRERSHGFPSAGNSETLFANRYPPQKFSECTFGFFRTNIGILHRSVILVESAALSKPCKIGRPDRDAGLNPEDNREALA
jgi:hypothetical protein